MAMRRRHLAATLVSGALALAVAPLAGDWLQLRDGSRVETRGAWQVRGEQVVFTLAGGKLVAARLAEVDLEASARLTAAARAPRTPEADAPPARPPAVVLTDADLGSRSAPGATSAPSPADGAGTQPSAPTARAAVASAQAAATATGVGLEVQSWSSRYDAEAGETVVAGTLRNLEDTIAFEVKVGVTAHGSEGAPVRRADAVLPSPGLAPGGSGSFTARFPGATPIERLDFELAAERASLRRPPPDPQPTPTPAAATPPAPGAGAQRLEVTRWEPDPAGAEDGVALVGEVANRSTEVLYDLALSVTLFDADGKEAATTRALLATRVLQPGQSTTFRASFPGAGAFHQVRFSGRQDVR